MEKNKLMMIIIIALLVVLLAAIGVFSFFVIRLLNTDRESSNNPNQAVAVAQKLTPDQITTVPIADAFTANLALGTDGVEHYIRFSIGIEVNNTDKKGSDALITLLGANEIRTRTTINKIIRNKTYQEASRPDFQDVFGDEIKVKLQEEYNTNLIVGVLVNDPYTN